MELLTVKEVAARLGVTEQAVRNYINPKTGQPRLKASRIGWQWVVNASELDGFEVGGGGRGRRVKKNGSPKIGG